MKCTLKKITDDVELLVSRLKSKESTADNLRKQIISVQSDLLSMRRYQEEMRTFHELSEKLSDHPKGSLILSLAAENKQLEQLKLENESLCSSLDEHQTALDLIMSKYRVQMLKLMQANRVESLIKSTNSTLPTQSQGTAAADHSTKSASPDLVTAQLINSADTNTDEAMANSQSADALALSQRMSTLAVIAQDVCDRGDAYTSQLETELFRLRTENTGLREMLAISSACSLDPIDGSDLTNAAHRDSIVSTDSPGKSESRGVLPNSPSHMMNSDSVTFDHSHPIYQVVSGRGFSDYSTNERDVGVLLNQDKSDDEDSSSTVIMDGGTPIPDIACSMLPRYNLH